MRGLLQCAHGCMLCTLRSRLGVGPAGSGCLRRVHAPYLASLGLADELQRILARPDDADLGVGHDVKGDGLRGRGEVRFKAELLGWVRLRGASRAR